MLIPKTSRPTSVSHLRPITVANDLKKLYELTLVSKGEVAGEARLPPEVLGFPAGRQANDMLYVINKVHAQPQATSEALYIGKLDINIAFDNTYLHLAEEAASHYTGRDMARALIAEHRAGKLTLRATH